MEGLDGNSVVWNVIVVWNMIVVYAKFKILECVGIMNFIYLNIKILIINEP